MKRATAIAGIVTALLVHSGMFAFIARAAGPPAGDARSPAPTADAAGAHRMDGRVYEVLLVAPGAEDRADRLLFRDGGLVSFQLERLDYAPGPCSFQDQREGWTLSAGMTSPAGGRGLWQANVQEDAIEGTLAWTKSDGATTTLTFTGALLPPLYQRLGGVNVIAEIVNDFADRLREDPLVNANPRVAAGWARVPAPALKYRMISYLVEATGGADRYSGRGLREAHAALAISGPEWDAMRADLDHALAAHRVPATEAEEIFHILEGVKADVVDSPAEVRP